MLNELTPAQQATLDNLFTYHAPTPEQQERYQRLRAAAKKFCAEIVICTPPCADQTAAVRLLRQSLTTANAAIACNEPVGPVVPAVAAPSLRFCECQTPQIGPDSKPSSYGGGIFHTCLVCGRPVHQHGEVR